MFPGKHGSPTVFSKTLAKYQRPPIPFGKAPSELPVKEHLSWPQPLDDGLVGVISEEMTRKRPALCLKSSNSPKYFHLIPSYQDAYKRYHYWNELFQTKICMSHGPVRLFSEHPLFEWSELIRLINFHIVFLRNYPCAVVEHGYPDPGSD